MTQNVSITPGSGTTIAADLVTDVAGAGTGAADVQYMKIVDATIGGTNKLVVNSDGAAKASTRTDMVTASGSLTGVGQAVTLSNLTNTQSATIIVSGTFVGDVTFEFTDDGTTWYTLHDTGGYGSANSPETLYFTGLWGFLAIRARCDAYTSGSIGIVVNGYENDGAGNSSGALNVTLSGGSTVSLPTNAVSGTFGGAGIAQTWTVGSSGYNTYGVVLTGTWSGTLVFEGSTDGTTWFSVPGSVPSTGAIATSTTSNGTWMIDVASLQQVRLRFSVWASGGATFAGFFSSASALIGLDQPLPSGTNIIGKVGIDQTTPGTTNAHSISHIGSTAVVTGGVNGTLAVGGVTAAAATATGNPVRVGAIGRTANPAAVTDGQVANLMTDKMGRAVVVPGHVRELVGTQATTITSSTVATTIVNAAGVSTFADITFLSLTNSSATATIVTLSDGTVSMVFNLPAGGSFVSNFMPPLKATTANTTWTLTCGTSVASVYVAAQYVKNL